LAVSTARSDRNAALESPLLKVQRVAVLWNEAADAAHFAALRDKGKAESEASAKAREETLEKKRANLRVARAAQASAAAKGKTKS